MCHGFDLNIFQIIAEIFKFNMNLCCNLIPLSLMSSCWTCPGDLLKAKHLYFPVFPSKGKFTMQFLRRYLVAFIPKSSLMSSRNIKKLRLPKQTCFCCSCSLSCCCYRSYVFARSLIDLLYFQFELEKVQQLVKMSWQEKTYNVQYFEEIVV